MNHSTSFHISHATIAVAVAASLAAMPLAASADQENTIVERTAATQTAAQNNAAVLTSTAQDAQAAVATTVSIDKRWTATDEENETIIAACEKAQLNGTETLKAYLQGKAVPTADFADIDTKALASIDEDLAKHVTTVQEEIAATSSPTEPVTPKPETPEAPEAPSSNESAPAPASSSTAGTASAEHVDEAPEDMVQESDLLADDIVYVARNLTTQQFIDAISNDARNLCQENDLYASVMIAQAVVESASGSSGLSCEPYNNLFGIKGSYDGNSVRMKTQEDDGEGHLETVVAQFRKYPSMLESLEDYVSLLAGDSLYAPAKKSNTESYEDACDYLQGHYATSTSYSRTLKAYIDAYDLTEYDKPVEEAKAEVTLDNVLTPVAMHTVSTADIGDFSVSVPEPGLPARKMSPVVGGLLAALGAAAVGALGFWLYWRRKVEGERAAACAGAHAAPATEESRSLNAEWLAEVTGASESKPAHAGTQAAATTGAHAAGHAGAHFAASIGAHAAEPEARPLDAAWLAEVVGESDSKPAHAKQPAHAANGASEDDPAEPVSL